MAKFWGGQRGGGDPYAPHATAHRAFLDQARWHQDQQRQRTASFQTNAAALLGFNGVLLGLLVTGGMLGNSAVFSIAWWAGLAAVVAFTVSAGISISALVPAGTAVVGAGATIQQWGDHLAQGGYDDSTYQFAHMLLGTNHTAAGDRKLRRPATTQPLRAAEESASKRGRRVLSAGLALLVGVIALAVALIAPAVVSAIPAGHAHARELHPSLIIVRPTVEGIVENAP
jgi:hypothetical protein